MSLARDISRLNYRDVIHCRSFFYGKKYINQHHGMRLINCYIRCFPLFTRLGVRKGNLEKSSCRNFYFMMTKEFQCSGTSCLTAFFVCSSDGICRSRRCVFERKSPPEQSLGVLIENNWNFLTFNESSRQKFMSSRSYISPFETTMMMFLLIDKPDSIDFSIE